MLKFEIPALVFIVFLIITFLFSLKDNDAKDVRLRFLFTPIISIVLYKILMFLGQL